MSGFYAWHAVLICSWKKYIGKTKILAIDVLKNQIKYWLLEILNSGQRKSCITLVIKIKKILGTVMYDWMTLLCSKACLQSPRKHGQVLLSVEYTWERAAI